MSSNHLERVRVGSRIAVYFQKDKCYYACEVLKKNGSKFQVKYEDNTLEWTVLSKEKFRWQDKIINTDDEWESSEDEQEEEDEESSEASDAEDAAKDKDATKSNE